MIPLALLGAPRLLWSLGALAAAAAAVWGYGAWKYSDGVSDTELKYEKRAIAADTERQAIMRERFRQGELAQRKFDDRTKETERALARTKDQLGVLLAGADELRDAATRRGAGTVEPGDTCRTERERIAEGERLLLEGAIRVGACNRLAAEGEGLYRGAADKLDLATDHIEALSVGAPAP